MIRRTTAFCFILLANIILLVQVAVPFQLKCRNCERRCSYHFVCDAKKHSETNQNKSKGCKKRCNFCILKQSAVFPPNSDRPESRWLKFPNNHHGFQGVLSDLQLETYISMSASNADPPPLITSSHSHFINSVKGLRAPPVA